jgi:hypothetical protein
MGRGRALVAGTTVLLVGLGGTLLLNGDDGGTSTRAPSTSTVAAAPVGRPAITRDVAPRALGDRILSGDVRLVVQAVVDPFEGDDAVVTAPAGWRWVAADVDVANLSAAPVVLSSHQQFVLRDVTDRRFGLAETAEDLPTLDGALAPGRSRRATLVFEVPEEAQDLRLIFDGPGAAPPVDVSLG